MLFDGNGKRIAIAGGKTDIMQSIDIEYERANHASYFLCRIPKYSFNGKRITPRVALTSADGSLNGAKASALSYAMREGTIFTINAGLFDMTKVIPVGQTIIDGVSITNTPMTDDNGTPISDAECYPLCIDEDGILSAPYPRNVDTADMIADGVRYAVTGWGKIIDNFQKCDETVFHETVHPVDYMQQCIGQYDNGDYCVLTVNMARNGQAENDIGMTYDEVADILIASGVEFAYVLDGGGSSETVIGERQLNAVYEGTTGRAVPTVIYFDVDEDFGDEDNGGASSGGNTPAVKSVNGKTGVVYLGPDDVGAESSGAVSSHDTSDTSHSDIRLMISEVSSKVNGQNSDVATVDEIKTYLNI